MSQNPQPPKKPLNPYMKFVQQKLETLRVQHPTKAPKELMTLAADLYNGLSEKDKKPYQDTFL